ncbi:Rpn family recombination-promoting nuclease/putative transposase [Natroniella sulfidigena]|uniref:Rpn family recombination-promoting nuclease/putative transposase n=1 Tax=Natroniella sulfidigena TaxID=723921 RepID=UPI00200B4A7B|nr:Rpn family recombination-promoting nuclease/putative transposase [Natroniella sulfidigena]MCK8816017.1 Rpn family recombination-promoting nuclease/putative transposase [Natroniella sulfidigena]
MIEERIKELKEAAETLEVLSQDEEARELYEARQKAIHDQVSNLEEARREAKEKGREEGREEGIEIGQGLGMAALIEIQLTNKFKSIPKEYIKKLKEQSDDKLKIIGTKIFEMEEIEELEEYLD